MNNEPETIRVRDSRIACDGSGEFLRHLAILKCGCKLTKKAMLIAAIATGGL
jgi:hypothetical protein